MNKYTQRAWDRVVGYGTVPEEYRGEDKEKPMQSYFKRQLDIPCIDICIVGDDECCVACGRTVVEMAIVSDAEKL